MTTHSRPIISMFVLLFLLAGVEVVVGLDRTSLPSNPAKALIGSGTHEGIPPDTTSKPPVHTLSEPMKPKNPTKAASDVPEAEEPHMSAAETKAKKRSYTLNYLGISNKTWNDLSLGFSTSVLASFFAALVSLIFGYFLATYRGYWFKRRFGRFFGGYHTRKAFTFILDHYRGSHHPTTEMGSCNAYILTYLSPLFDKYIGKYPNVVLDNDFKDWEQTLVLLGSPFTNSVTKKSLVNNKYLKFTGKDDSAESIEILTPDYDGPPLRTAKGHHGVVLKLVNPYSKGHSLFFLAGLTNESTSAGGLFLRKHWIKILKAIGESEFLIVYQVELPGEDQTFKILYTHPISLQRKLDK